jgi:hypothetical protein
MKRFAFVLMPTLAILAFFPLSQVGASMAYASPLPAHAARVHHTGKVLFLTRQEWKKLHPSSHIGQASYAQGSGDLAYNGGPVQHYPVSYLIFWGPDWVGADSGTAGVVQSYFNDLSGTAFENILTQYYDYSGNIVNTHSVGGVWFDTSTPPSDTSCGGATVEDSSLQSEVANAIAANGWPTDGSNAVYYVYTNNGYYINDGTGACSEQVFCAYHNWSSSDGVAYAAMAYPFGSGCQVPSSPNGNLAGDSLDSVTSHEQFEAATDPQPGSGWVDAAGYEIGDKCAWDFSAGYTYLNNGGTFELQTEYSNATSSCVNAY